MISSDVTKLNLICRIVISQSALYLHAERIGIFSLVFPKKSTTKHWGVVETDFVMFNLHKLDVEFYRI